MKADRKRAKEIWEIAGRLQIPHEIVQKAIYEDVVSVADFKSFWTIEKSKGLPMQCRL